MASTPPPLPRCGRELNRQIPAKEMHTYIHTCIVHTYTHILIHDPQPVFYCLLNFVFAASALSTSVWHIVYVMWGCLNASSNSFSNLLYSTSILLTTEYRPQLGAPVRPVAQACLSGVPLRCKGAGRTPFLSPGNPSN